MQWKPAVYKTSGGDEQVVTTGGVLKFDSGVLKVGSNTLISSGGGISLGSLTSGDVTFPGRVTATSGINASTGAITGNLSVGGNATMTSGLNATTGSFTGNITGGANLALTSGLNATTGTFTGNVTGVNVTLTSGLSASTGVFSSAVTVGHTLAVTSGISGSSGTFTTSVAIAGGLAVTSGGTFTGLLTANGGIKEAVEAGTSSGGVMTGYGITSIKSCEGNPVVYTLTPALGYIKYITCQNASATTGAAIVLTTGTFDGTNVNALFSTGNTNPQWLMLAGASTSRWLVLGRSTDVTFTNT